MVSGIIRGRSRRLVNEVENESVTESCTDDAVDERSHCDGRTFSNVIAAGNQALRFRQLGVAIVMNCGERFAFFRAVANALVKFETYAVIDLVFLFFAAAAQHGERNAEALAVRTGDEATRRTRDIETRTRLRQPLRLGHHPLVPALQSNSFPEFFP